MTSTINKETCPTCGQTISRRKVAFSRAMLSAALKMYHHAMRQGSQTVLLRECGVTHTEYANANNLVRFGLAYKNDDMVPGEYGVPRKRIEAFMANDWTVARYAIIDTDGSHELSEERITWEQVPSIEELRTIYGDKFTEFLSPIIKPHEQGV